MKSKVATSDRIILFNCSALVQVKQVIDLSYAFDIAIKIILMFTFIRL